MKISAIITFLAAIAPITMATGLDKKSCKPSKCLCIGDQTQFCGNEAINSACTNGHVFECNAQTGKTCDYGPRDSCAKCGQLSC